MGRYYMLGPVEPGVSGRVTMPFPYQSRNPRAIVKYMGNAEIHFEADASWNGVPVPTIGTWKQYGFYWWRGNFGSARVTRSRPFMSRRRADHHGVLWARRQMQTFEAAHA